MMKQTEIGLIPDDWEVKKFSDLFDFCTTTILTENINKSFYVGTENMMPNKMGVTNNTIDLSYLNVREYKENDILVSNIRPYLKKIWLADKKGGCSSDVLVFRRKDKQSHPLFLYMLVSNDRFFQIVNDNAVGTKMPRGDKKIISEIQFALPSSKIEQQRIAKTLSDVDILISTTEKLIQKKKNIKQGTMQNLLTGKKRLPGFGPQTKSPTYKQTELGPIPEDWEVKSLGEIFEFRPNNTFTRDCLNDSKGKYQNVHYGDVLIKYPSILDCSKETIPFINEGINVKFSKYGIVEGDIIIADTAEDETVGKVVEVFNLGEKKIVSGLHTFLCRKITDDFAPKWLGYFMNQAIFHNQLLPFITGTKVSAISRTAIQNVKVLIPLKEEQTAIANILSSMDKEIETLNTKLEKYRNLKTAMMQQLLTGKIRLGDPSGTNSEIQTKHSIPLSFKRSVLAAEIVNRLYNEPTFGHVKLQKLIFLTERMCSIDIDSSYHRDAAGPYDNYGMRSIDSQLKKQKWFSAEFTGNGYHYNPLENQGGHKQYFERYFADKKDTFDLIIQTFRTVKTEQCEIVATLYSAWEDFLKKGVNPNDEQIITDVLTNWHESKKRISKDRWMNALSWMKKHNFKPNTGKFTK